MAVFHCDYRSKVMEGNVSFNVIIPEQCLEDIPTVYLLHGIAGNHDDWFRFSAIERYASERGLAIVMPAAGKSFYTDMVHGPSYYTFITKELCDYVRRIFPLSSKREKNFVCGLSMGGYGALKICLSNPDSYAACGSLSGVPDIYERLKDGANKKVAEAVWGDDYLKKIPGSKDDLYALIEKIQENGQKKPWIFQACGTDDSLYENNLKFKAFVESRDFTYEYGEGPGAHTWDVWDYWIPKALDFFKRYMAENGVKCVNDEQYVQPIVKK